MFLHHPVLHIQCPCMQGTFSWDNYKYSHTYMTRSIYLFLSSLFQYKCNYQIFRNLILWFMSAKQHPLISFCRQNQIHTWNLLHCQRSASCTDRTWKLNLDFPCCILIDLTKNILITHWPSHNTTQFHHLSYLSRYNNLPFMKMKYNFHCLQVMGTST